MATILYKFRSGTNFESLPLPGTSARLFDVKRAIVRAKKLDRSSTGSGLEFDLAVQNAATNESYEDESMILPRGTRIIVRRVSAERNQGLLSRMARAEVSGGGVPPPTTGYGGGNGASAARDGFYTFRSRDRDDEEEFTDQEPLPQSAAVVAVDEEKELEALKAVTDQAGSMYGAAAGMSRNAGGQVNKVWTAGGGGGSAVAGGGGGTGGMMAGSGAPHGRGGGGAPHFPKPPHSHSRVRPNADPELREQELRQQPQPKRRATGIPRTFLSLGAPSQATGGGAVTGGDGERDGEGGIGGGDPGAEAGGLASQLQPSTVGFEALVHRAGGQSETNSAGKRRDLDYALKLTATSVPEHLQCGICGGVVKSAMLIPWDTEGRPACETCIRDALAQSGFKCPLTGTEGVSPDDLFPNVGLRKAADLFIRGVMEKMDQIEKQIEEEEAEEEKRSQAAALKEKGAGGGNIYEGDSGDKGILITRKNAKQAGKKRQDDLFGGDDEFGGDVFDVANDDVEPEGGDETVYADISNPEQLKSDASKPSGTEIDSSSSALNNNKMEPTEHAVSNAEKDRNESSESNKMHKEDNVGQKNDNNNNRNIARKYFASPIDSTSASQQTQSSSTTEGKGTIKNPNSPSQDTVASTASSRGTHHRREHPKRRGPPAGYVLGPAGGGGLPAGSSTPNKFAVHASAVGGRMGTGMPMPHEGAGGFGNMPPPPPPPMGGRGSHAPGVMPMPAQYGRGGHGGGRCRYSQDQFGARSLFQDGRGGGRNVTRFHDQQQQQQQQQQHHPQYPHQQHQQSGRIQQQQQQGGFRDSGRGGRQSFPQQIRSGYPGRGSEQQDQFWGDNASINGDWNRGKRSRDTMESSSMAEMAQQGWGGSGGGRDFQVRGGQHPQYSGGRGGRGGYEGRGQLQGRSFVGGGGRGRGGGGYDYRGRGGCGRR